MPRGGRRPGSGPKKKFRPQTPGAATPEQQRRSKIIYEALCRPAKDDDSFEIKRWREICNAEPAYLWKLFEHSEGRAVHTVNHLHDKPIEMNVNLSIAEVVRKVRERREAYEKQMGLAL